MPHRCRISSPVGFSGSKLHTATGPGIASILAVIHESDHAHFLTSFVADKVNALWHTLHTLLRKPLHPVVDRSGIHVHIPICMYLDIRRCLLAIYHMPWNIKQCAPRGIVTPNTCTLALLHAFPRSYVTSALPYSQSTSMVWPRSR